MVSIRKTGLLAFLVAAMVVPSSVLSNEGKAFLEANAGKPGVITTASGLQYKVIKEGDGISPVATDLVNVHYHGTLIDGEVFDSSVDRGEPASFALNQVIRGWTEGLQLMREGGKTRFYIPANLAYGNRQVGKISPGSTLVFDVELLRVLALNLPTDIAGIRAFKIAAMDCGKAPALPADKAGLEKVRPAAESYMACVREYYQLVTSQLQGLGHMASGSDDMRDLVLDKIAASKKDLSSELDSALAFMKRYQEEVAR